MLAVKSGLYSYSGKILALDLDGTLLGSIRESWIIAPEKITKLKELSKDNDLTIFSNQAPPHPTDLKERVSELIKVFIDYNIPIVIFMALYKDLYRKPELGMWNKFKCYYNLYDKYNIKDVTFVGDASGDSLSFSDSDKVFLGNIQKEEKEVRCTFITPKNFFPFSYNLIKDYDMIILVGYPASGKSTLADKLQQDQKRTVISRDVLKTMPKCLKVANEELLKNNKIVINNLNGNIKAREPFISLAKLINKSVVCLDMNVSMLDAMERNKKRSDNGGKKIPNIVYYTFRKNYQRVLPEECQVYYYN